MKVLLMADLQLEGGLSLGHGEYGSGSRFHDQEQALHQIADIADAEDVELAILAGDTFDRPKPSPWAILAMQEFLERMPQVLIIPGNHDTKSLALPSVLSCLVRGGVKICYLPQAVVYEGLRVSVLPWQPLGAFSAHDLPPDRDESHSLVGMLLANKAQQLGSLTAHSSERHILVGHWSVSSGMTNTGVGVEVFREPVIPCEALASAGFDMVAFGHVHLVQVLNQEPPVLYLGAPWPGSFGEVGRPHGVWCYDSEKPEMRFIPVASRPVLAFDADTDGSFDAILADHDLTGCVVRLRYSIDESEVRSDDQTATRDRFLAAGCHKVIVQPQVIRGSRARVESEGASDLTPDRAVQVFLDTTDGSPEQAARAREMHDEYVGRLA